MIDYHLVYIFMIGVCQNNPCKNGGTCTLVNGSPKCTCIRGLTGATCETSKPVLVIFRFLSAKSSIFHANFLQNGKFQSKAAENYEDFLALFAQYWVSQKVPRFDWKKNTTIRLSGLSKCTAKVFFNLKMHVPCMSKSSNK